MAAHRYHLVSAEESEIHDEPHIANSRVTVLDVVRRVEERGLAPERVADRFSLDIADVYEALAYYHNNPEEMDEIEARHEAASEEAKRRSNLEPTE